MAKKHPQIQLPSLIPNKDAVMVEGGRREITKHSDNIISYRDDNDILRIEWANPPSQRGEPESNPIATLVNGIMIGFSCVCIVFILGVAMIIVSA